MKTIAIHSNPFAASVDGSGSTPLVIWITRLARSAPRLFTVNTTREVTEELKLSDGCTVTVPVVGTVHGDCGAVKPSAGYISMSYGGFSWMMKLPAASVTAPGPSAAV